MSQSLIPIDALSSAYWENLKKKKKGGEEGNGQAAFSQGWTHLAGCVALGFHGC
jgi:hypothetical protein